MGSSTTWADEVFIGEDLKRILEERGAVVLGPSMTVAGAMKLATSELLDAAILDVGLGGEDVTVVAAVLASRGIPFVFCSGYQRDLAYDQWPDAPWLGKPVSEDVLISALGGLAAPLSRAARLS